MLSRVYRIPKGVFCVGTTPCAFLAFGGCAHFVAELRSVWTGEPGRPFPVVRLPQCLLDFPNGGIVTVDAEGPSRADVQDGDR